ncbi:uncharacterized protein [Glycine max]|uniref:uncharacterized protein n=1 Tax=Glycine max TaxID=3847 RepID=UPI0003DEA927|nr:uncharacterized protein LOC100796439 [Glycine max]|eukprot:XP_006596670.1 uncharacterized protein LOC100796439 [Glycine max]
MDRSWMTRPRISDEYDNGVEDFLQFAKHNAAPIGGLYLCPCVNCLNGRRQYLDDIRTHLICDGISPNYTKWIWHGELPQMSSSPLTAPVDEEVGDHIEDMLRDLGQEGFRQAHSPYYESLDTDSTTPLYMGCTKYTRLSAVLGLVNLKARFGWSDKSFNESLLLLKNMLPVDNTLPKNHYKAKKILCPVGMEYHKIHACPNDCISYRHQFAEKRSCPTCGASRYKVKSDESSVDGSTYKDCPSKVCWYLPVIPRFKRLFANAQDAKNLTWHVDGRIKDGLLRHPADSPQWKSIDELYSKFGQDPRNLRVGLTSDGMNTFGNLSCNHSS